MSFSDFLFFFRTEGGIGNRENNSKKKCTQKFVQTLFYQHLYCSQFDITGLFCCKMYNIPTGNAPV